MFDAETVVRDVSQTVGEFDEEEEMVVENSNFSNSR